MGTVNVSDYHKSLEIISTNTIILHLGYYLIPNISTSKHSFSNVCLSNLESSKWWITRTWESCAMKLA